MQGRHTTLPPSLHAQRGIALLTVLFILVLLSTLAVYTAEDENIAIRRAENQRSMEQAFQLSIAGEQWLAKALERDLQSSPQVDSLADEWAKLDSSVVSVEDGQMVVDATDESGKFNLNNLVVGKQGLATPGSKHQVTAWYGYFVRLLDLLGLEEELADAVVDWVDSDDKQTGNGGAEDSQYQSFDPSYLAANRSFVSISELMWVEGFDAEKVDKLRPYVTALPVDHQGKIYTLVNVNTAPAMVLRALEDPPVDQQLVDSALRSRDVTPFTRPDAAYSFFNLQQDRARFAQIAAVGSEYFSVQSCARFGRIEVSLESLLKRDNQAQEATVLSRQRRYNCGIGKATDP